MLKANLGLIIAAGEQTRFNDSTPKALSIIDGKCLLDINYENMSKFCHRIYVVCSYKNEKFFDDTKYRKIVINSGLGSGDAILKAINNILATDWADDNVFIQWGDSIVNENIYNILLEKYSGKTLIPCVKESKPYVQIVQNGKDKIHVLFSKYSDNITEGLHDMSIFLCPIKELLSKLKSFNRKFYDKKLNKYIHKHNEFEFLDIFNETNIKANIIELDDSLKSFSFNTIEELENYTKGGKL